MNKRTVFLCSKAQPRGQASFTNDRDLCEFGRVTQGMTDGEKLGTLRQFIENGASAFLIFKIVDGFQKDWQDVNKLFSVIRPLLGQAMEDEDDAQSQVIARVLAYCCQMSDDASDVLLKEHMAEIFGLLTVQPEYYLVVMELVTYINSNEAKRIIYAEQLDDVILLIQGLIEDK